MTAEYFIQHRINGKAIIYVAHDDPTSKKLFLRILKSERPVIVDALHGETQTTVWAPVGWDYSSFEAKMTNAGFIKLPKKESQFQVPITVIEEGGPGWIEKNQK